jgi:hypothetical protein
MLSSYTELAGQVSRITGLIKGGIFFFVVLILTLVVLRVIWTGRHQKKTKKLPPTALKTCPDCAEQVQMAARICRYCRYDFAAWPPNAAPPPNTPGWPSVTPPSPYGSPPENQAPKSEA